MNKQTVRNLLSARLQVDKCITEKQYTPKAWVQKYPNNEVAEDMVELTFKPKSKLGTHLVFSAKARHADLLWVQLYQAIMDFGISYINEPEKLSLIKQHL